MQGKGVYNSLKELNVIDKPLWLEFWQRVNNKLDNQASKEEIDITRLEKALSHLELGSNMSTKKERKEVD